MPRDDEWQACVCLAAALSRGDVRDVKSMRRVARLAERMTELDECEFDEEVVRVVKDLHEMDKARPDLCEFRRQLRGDAQRLAASLGDGASRVDAARGGRAGAPPPVPPKPSAEALAGVGLTCSPGRPRPVPPTASMSGGEAGTGPGASVATPVRPAPSTLSAPSAPCVAATPAGPTGPTPSSRPSSSICGVKRKAEWTDSESEVGDGDMELALTSSSASSCVSSGDSGASSGRASPRAGPNLLDALVDPAWPALDMPDLNTFDDIEFATKYMNDLLDGDLDELMD